jgi:hypothetical protein
VSSAGSEAPTRRGRHAKPRAKSSRLFRWRGTIFSLVAYLFLAFLANKNVWIHGFAHTLQASGGNDTGEEVWFLAQTPWAIVHGVNPFANNWLNAPVGIDLMDNTTMPLLGVLGAPITFLFGPIATLNVMMVLGFSASAMAFFVMARRFTRWWPAAFIGGLLYGFSPFAVAEGTAHLFLVFNVVPPLIVLVIHRFVSADHRSPWRYGAALGGCYLAQFYISTEALASVVVVSLIAVIVGGALLIRRVDVDLEKVARMGAAAAVVAILGVGYGAWVALEGPQHIHGPAQTSVAIAGISSDPAGLVVPTEDQHFTFNEATLGDTYVAQRDAHWHIIIDATLENGTYVGVPLLLILITGIIVLRRNRFAVFAGVMAAIVMVLSMGSYLHVDGHLTPVPLPFIVLAHLPLLDSGSASRYVSLFWLFAALLLAMTLDWVHEISVPRIRAGWSAVVCLLVAAFALVPLVPAWPYPASAAVVPHWFTSNARALPAGTTAVIFPSSNPGDASAMLWQAMSDMTFRMPGGYAVFASSPSGTASFYAEPSVLENAMTSCVSGVTPQISPEETRSVLHGWKARYVVVVPGTTGATCATKLFDGALGAHRTEGGVSVWSTGTAG